MDESKEDEFNDAGKRTSLLALDRRASKKQCGAALDQTELQSYLNQVEHFGVNEKDDSNALVL